jgi:hypothetical protein
MACYVCGGDLDCPVAARDQKYEGEGYAMSWLLDRVTSLPGIRGLWRFVPVGTVPTRVRHGILSKPPYAQGVYAAADLAKRLNLPAISALEFGVAGGRGLVALERAAKEVGEHFGIQISVFGFDTGKGMPAPSDYRDLPHVWGKEFYPMDEEKLRRALTSATLILGDVGATVPEFMAAGHPPIGFVSFDLDYYSSTKQAFRIFESGCCGHLPRVQCYFDDIFWPEAAAQNEYVGELCAIKEFNLEHEDQKICQIYGLRHLFPHPAIWHDQMYVMHHFGHPLYCKSVVGDNPGDKELPL